jgi:hypothetical protein
MCLSDLNEVRVCNGIVSLAVKGNPVCSHPGLIGALVVMLPRLIDLDGSRVDR